MLCNTFVEVVRRHREGERLVDTRFSLQIYPHATRTGATEAYRSNAIVVARETRTGELRVTRFLGTLNPADAMTKFIDYTTTLEKHFEKLGPIWTASRIRRLVIGTMLIQNRGGKSIRVREHAVWQQEVVRLELHRRLGEEVVHPPSRDQI